MPKAKLFTADIKNANYNRTTIENVISNLITYKPHPILSVTKYKDELLSQHLCTCKYTCFDFRKFVLDNLPIIETNFAITNYDLRIVKGNHELKLLGKKMKLGSEIYLQQFNIASSTNGYHPLSINAGLLRQVCSNGQMLGVPGASMQIKAKHYKQALNNAQIQFENEITNIDNAFLIQAEHINCINTAEVSLKEFVKRYFKNKIATEYYLHNTTIIKHLFKNLLESKYDKLENINKAQQEILLAPTEFIANKTNDLYLPKRNLYHCYTELFKERPTAIIAKESTRIWKILNGIS